MDELRGTKAELLAMKHFGIGILLAMLAFQIIPMIWQACFHNVWTSQRKLLLGKTKQEVIRLFGSPRRDSEDGYWVYDRDLFDTIFVYFNEDGTVEDYTL